MQNKVIRMTEEIWNLPAGAGCLNRAGHYCALGKIALALGEEVPDVLTDFYGHNTIASKIMSDIPGVWSKNDRAISAKIVEGKTISVPSPMNHEIAIRYGIEYLVERGYTLETDDTVSRELARIKNSIATEVV